jgi:predicted DNA-binding antitoxin AbrB/MazE fold protein
MKHTAIRARVKRGRLEPLEKLDLPEGHEVTLTIVDDELPDDAIEASIKKAAGGWKGTGGTGRLVKDIYRSRLVRTRPEPRL